MDDFLDTMRGASLQRVASRRQSVDDATMRRQAMDTPKPPLLQLHANGFDLIAEMKRRSPSAGALTSSSVPPSFAAAQAQRYARGGAAAVSVLTEPTQFGGSLEDLTHAAGAVDVPVMRKDFLVDPYQVFEARAAGAGGVLLIVRMLASSLLDAMLDAAAECELFVLLEIFDDAEVAPLHMALDRARNNGVHALVGVNGRDLRSLGVDADRFQRLAPSLPPDWPWVAESGLATTRDVRRVAALGFRLALVGEALMGTEDPARTTADFVDAGRMEAIRCR